MAETELRRKVARGLFWKILENGGAQGVQFVIAILLARLLTPAEYGVVGIIAIFITIGNVFVQSGFSTALIQKRKTDELDFSSVCYFELAAAAGIYVCLYLAAPAIGRFYQLPVLKEIVRALGFVLFPGAVISVQTAYVSRTMEFRGLFFSTLTASVASGILSIAMAYAGWGVWAMVWQQIGYYVALMIALFVTVSWRPGLHFSMQRVGVMFSFGWKLLCASLLDTVFNNLYGLLIGKLYSEDLLGSYNRGEQFPKLIATNLSSAIQAVLLPAFSEKQEDRGAVYQMVRRAIRLSSFVVLPMLFGLFAVGDTLVLALLGEAWMVCVPFLRIMCISYCFWPIHITNLQAINAVGHSDIFLKLEIIKKFLSLAALLIGMQFDVYTMVCLKAVQDFICTFVNAAPNKRLLGYSIVHQWMDIAPAAALSAIMCIAVIVLGKYAAGVSVWGRLGLQIVAGIGIYLFLAALFRMDSLRFFADMAAKKIHESGIGRKRSR